MRCNKITLKNVIIEISLFMLFLLIGYIIGRGLI